MEIDLKAVRKTGSELFPELADVFGGTAAIVEEVMSDKSPRAMYNKNYAENWVWYANVVRRALDTSRRHLEDCGETLVMLVDEYDLTDSDAADRVRYGTESSLDVQLGIAD